MLTENRKLLAEVDDGCIEQIGAAIRSYQSASTREHFQDVHDRLSVSLAALEGLIDKTATEPFGAWGAYFFRVALQHESLNDRIFNRTPKRRLVPSDEAQPHRVFAGMSWSIPKECDIHLGEDDFSISIGDRPKCHLGNTIQFRLLLALWRRRNRYVDVLDLTDEAGGEEGNIDNFPAWKSRLLTDLRNGGYPDLAACVAKTLRCVGLFVGK